ncbi:MAG: heme o synthase [Phycisphaeraceae bacterium]
MTTASTGTTTLVRPLSPITRTRELWTIYMELAKSRLSMLVVMTAAVGYVMALPTAMYAAGIGAWLGLIWTSLGTALAAGSANAFNQIIEIERDRRMNRTRNRPLPAGRIGTRHAVLFAIVIGITGVAMLALQVNTISAALAGATILLYVAVYTPLKPRTTLNTLVGGVVGALPPMLGWAGVTGSIDPGAWVLGAILFVWQMPHFLSLAWMYRDDYAAGGYRMLPGVDDNGRITCGAIMMYALALGPISLAAATVGIAGMIYAGGAIALAIWLIVLAARLMRDRTRDRARKLFLASVMYLPLLMLLLVADRTHLPRKADTSDPITPAITAQYANRTDVKMTNDESITKHQ